MPKPRKNDRKIGDEIQRCASITSHTRIRLAERGKKIIIKNENGHAYCCIKVDGCCITRDRAADWIVARDGVGDVILELKGRHVEHGISQVEGTLLWWKARKRHASRIGAVIISAQYPSFDTKIQRAKERLMRDHGVRLRVKTVQWECEFEELL